MSTLDGLTDLTTIAVTDIDIDEDIALVTLDRPDQLNAITSTMITELERVVSAVDLDPDLRAVEVTGAGRGFCSGLDLREQGTAPGAEAVRRGVHVAGPPGHAARTHPPVAQAMDRGG